ncbi:hypothetical protein ACET3X_001490 [Alternaria dauci]|uniref:DUF985 domain-containing protein n=1 Tax=Alternaria dauci TaxID=48095 RepID=A0ABR3UYK6_9PLEO
MLPPKSDPGYEERLKLLSNVRDKWDPRTKDSTAIPESMRYNGSISTWPLPILRGISALASDTPGDDAWNQVYDLLEEGQKKRMDDESNILPAQIQLSDLEYARKHYVQEKPIDLESGEGERRFVRKDEYENDTGFAAGENDDLASQSGNAPGSVSNTKANKDNPQNPQSDITTLEHEDGSDSFPPRILPNDTDAIRFQKYNLWIQHYWNVNDCKDLISEDMFPRDSKQNPMRGSKLENHGGMRKGELLELLYELARITGPSRRDAAWAKIREKWNARPPGKNGNKTLSIGDVSHGITRKYETAIISALNLQKHVEGGYYAEIDRNPLTIPNPFLSKNGGDEEEDVKNTADKPMSGDNAIRNASTSIYYMLSAVNPQGHFHRNKGRTIHTLISGRGRYVLIHADESGAKKRIETFVVGHDVANGEKSVWIVEGGKYKASFLLDGSDGERLLISETVIPGFEFSDHDFLTKERFEQLITTEQAKELDWLVRKS